MQSSFCDDSKRNQICKFGQLSLNITGNNYFAKTVLRLALIDYRRKYLAYINKN